MSFSGLRLFVVLFAAAFLLVAPITPVDAESPGGGGTCTGTGPTAVTNPATGITASSATLNGTKGTAGCAAYSQSPTSWFTYSTASTGGGRAPASGSATTVTITGLLPSTTYYFRLSATNNKGSATGATLHFTTLNIAPVIVTGAETGVGPNSATLNGTVDPNGDATTYYYRWGVAVAGATCVQLPNVAGYSVGNGGAGQGPTNRPVTITGLSSGTYYYYCLAGSNAAGLRYGAIGSFTAAGSLPQIVTSVATPISTTTATIYGTVDPNGLSTSVWFRYSDVVTTACDDTFGTKTSVVAGYTGAVPVSFNRPLAGLVENTTYYYCALGSNASGLGKGAIATFKTMSAPSVVTGAADDIYATQATINGEVNPNGSATTGWFRYSTTDPGTCNDTFGTKMGPYGPWSGTADVFPAVPATLTPGTIYYNCTIANNAYGTTFGEIETFTTPPLTPLITTSAATSITSSGATLNGTVNPRGAEADLWYTWGPTNGGGVCSALANYTASTVSGTGNSAVAIPPFALSSLSPSTTYYFCANGYNAADTDVSGSMLSFTTSAAPPPQCSDGLDNDLDTFTDLLDSGCANAADTTEAISTAMTLTAQPPRVGNTGGTVTLTYNNGGRTNCSIAGTNGNNSSIFAPGSGTFTTVTITQVTRYTLSCTGETQRAYVTVQKVPGVKEI